MSDIQAQDSLELDSLSCGWVHHIPQLIKSQGLTHPQFLKMASSSPLAIMF